MLAAIAKNNLDQSSSRTENGILGPQPKNPNN